MRVWEGNDESLEGLQLEFGRATMRVWEGYNESLGGLR